LAGRKTLFCESVKIRETPELLPPDTQCLQANDRLASALGEARLKSLYMPIDIEFWLLERWRVEKEM
jgi:hypothetical protein